MLSFLKMQILGHFAAQSWCICFTLPVSVNGPGFHWLDRCLDLRVWKGGLISYLHRKASMKKWRPKSKVKHQVKSWKPHSSSQSQQSKVQGQKSNVKSWSPRISSKSQSQRWKVKSQKFKVGPLAASPKPSPVDVSMAGSNRWLIFRKLSSVWVRCSFSIWFSIPETHQNGREQSRAHPPEA